MKVIKDRSNGALAKLSNRHAKKVIDAKDMLKVGGKSQQPIERFCYSSKGALKSRLNSDKKQKRIDLRLYFKVRKWNKQTIMTDNKNKVQIVDEIINDDYPRHISKLWFDDIAKKITSPNGKLSIVSGRVHSSVVFSKHKA